jgi:sec-independent protein translocase protein TatB
MFGIDWNEAIVIGLIALLVIGPKELPGMMRGLGQSLNKLRRMAANFRAEFDQAMKDADLQDLKESADSLRGAVSGLRSGTSPMSMIRNEVMNLGDTVKDAVAPPAPAIPAMAAPSTETNTIAAASSTAVGAAVATPALVLPPVTPAPVVLPDAPKKTSTARNKVASTEKVAIAKANGATAPAKTAAPKKAGGKRAIVKATTPKAAAPKKLVVAAPVEPRKKARKAVGADA